MALRDGKVMEALRKFRQNYGIVAGVAYAQDLAGEPRPPDLREYVELLMYRPEYGEYVEQA